MTTGEVAEQLRRIADELQRSNEAGLGAGEIWGGIVVPLLLGVATLVVAMVSILQTRKLNRDQLAREARSARRRLAEEIRPTARGWILSDRVPRLESKWLQDRNRVESEARALELPGVETLLSWVHQQPRFDINSVPVDQLGAALLAEVARLDAVIDSWAADPAGISELLNDAARLDALRERA